MLKAVFVDYTGTIIQEDGPDIQQLIMRAYQNSNIESPKAMVAYWWNKVKRYEEESFGERFITEDEIVDQILEDCREEMTRICCMNCAVASGFMPRHLTTRQNYSQDVRCLSILSAIMA